MARPARSEPKFKPARIREWRLDRNLTIEQLAARLEGKGAMTPGNLSRLERGMIPYTQEKLEALAYALGVDVAELVNTRPVSAEQKRWLAMLDTLKKEQKEQVFRVVSVFIGDKAA